MLLPANAIKRSLNCFEKCDITQPKHQIAIKIPALPCGAEGVPLAVGVILEVRVELGEVRLRPSRGGGGNEGEGKGQRGHGGVEAVHLDTQEED